MADVAMSSTTGTSSSYPIWDVIVTDGEASFITGDSEELQAAMIAAFLQLGTVPQLTEVGVDWTAYLLGSSTFGNLDMEIRDSLSTADCADYEPSYDIVDGELYTTIKRST